MILELRVAEGNIPPGGSGGPGEPGSPDTRYDVYLFWWDDAVTPIPAGTPQDYPRQLGSMKRQLTKVSYVSSETFVLPVYLDARVVGIICPILVVAVAPGGDPHTRGYRNFGFMTT